jgi:predicted amidophosphoribosyltransferase
VDPRLQDVPGFGSCGVCPYRDAGPAALCYECAHRTIEKLATSEERCETCDLPFNRGEEECRNPVCKLRERWFEWNFAVAMRSGELENAVNRYKYEDKRGWGAIFGRILAGFLEEQAKTFESFQLIVASPTWTGEGGRTFDHTSDVLVHAAAEAPPSSVWPFDDPTDPVIVKTAATPPMVGKGYKERRKVAEGELRAALAVRHSDRVAGKRILVYDDVFTDGLTLREVARALVVDGGASGVCGVTLCRQPYRARTPAVEESA